MDQKCKLKCIFFTIIHLHVIYRHEVIVPVADDEAAHQFKLFFLKKLRENKRLLFMQRKVVNNDSLLCEVLKINLLPKYGDDCLDSLSGVKHVKLILFLFFERCFDHQVWGAVLQVAHDSILVCELVDHFWWNSDGGEHQQMFFLLLPEPFLFHFFDVILFGVFEQRHLSQLLSYDQGVSLSGDNHVVCFISAHLGLLEVVLETCWDANDW